MASEAGGWREFYTRWEDLAIVIVLVTVIVVVVTTVIETSWRREIWVCISVS